MTLAAKYKPHTDRFVPYTEGRKVLMLGNQYSALGPPQTYFKAASYETIDPDGGDHRDSLTDDLPHLRRRFGAVVNIGTLEHIWDVHRAHCVSADLVEVGGYFCGVSPVVGQAMHGIHITSWWALLRFFRLNGYALKAAWFSDTRGNKIKFSKSGAAHLWFAAQRTEAVDDWQVPLQIYKGGKKPALEVYLREFEDVLC